MHGTEKLGIQPLPERGGQGEVSGDTHLGSREKQGPGSAWCSCPKQGMPWGAAPAPPESFPPALPEQTLQLARKQRFLLMGNVRAAEPVVALPRSPAGILGKHSRSSTGSGFVASGQGSALEFTPNSQHMPSAPALQPLSPGGRRGTDATRVAGAQACFLSDPCGSSALGKASQIPPGSVLSWQINSHHQSVLKGKKKNNNTQTCFVEKLLILGCFSAI